MGGAYAENLRRAVAVLEPLGPGDWNPDHLLDVLKRSAEEAGTRLGDAMQPIRVALTGSTVSEPVNELLAIVGPDRSLERLRRAAAER
jgi:glutamyl-tRNA synthetase